MGGKAEGGGDNKEAQSCQVQRTVHVPLGGDTERYCGHSAVDPEAARALRRAALAPAM
jgi:hypothetical protein